MLYSDTGINWKPYHQDGNIWVSHCQKKAQNWVCRNLKMVVDSGVFFGWGVAIWLLPSLVQSGEGLGSEVFGDWSCYFRFPCVCVSSGTCWERKEMWAKQEEMGKWIQTQYTLPCRTPSLFLVMKNLYLAKSMQWVSLHSPASGVFHRQYDHAIKLFWNLKK